MLDVPLKVQSCTREHLSHDIHGQCLHALYVSSVHVSDQHQNKYKYSCTELDLNLVDDCPDEYGVLEYL